MQFVANGPDVPDSLLQAHEEGRVVFFCGAGISYPAGLPGFEGLVDKIYSSLKTDLSDIEGESYTKGQYDAALGLLEQRIPGGAVALRSALAEALKPNFRKKGATETHESILTLAKNRDGNLRLVTTNFDRIFERAAKNIKQKIPVYTAPMLPPPKNSRWDGIVYLHGQLPEAADRNALKRLVVTSGDFGSAYLIERWASRFVSELFRNYVVCFVGYRIGDPVLRYMMDALAADRLQGEITPEAFAFADFESGKKTQKIIEWEAKGVIPILYEIPTIVDHSALHNTLKAWAETYRDGINGKERIVITHALAHPAASTQQDNFVGRMLWALSHNSGMPARRFADFNPAPPIEWLDVFSKKQYKKTDLIRFGIIPSSTDDELSFSFIDRPASYKKSSYMSLFSNDAISTDWDNVMHQVARWLSRHLGDKTLIIRLAQNGGLNEKWKRIIENKLEKLERLESKGGEKELQDIVENSPNAIPDTQTKIFWKLLLNGRVKSNTQDQDLYRWIERFKRYGLSTSLRLDIRELLSVKVLLREPYDWPGDINEEKNKRKIDWELVLSSNYVRHSLPSTKDLKWSAALTQLHNDFQLLLHDAMELLQELDAANEIEDRSFLDMPSISEHWQNRGFRDWVILIELVRDSWLAILNIDTVRAIRIAQEWFYLPYPVFKRLALFAASKGSYISANQWVGWLTANDSWWLWSVCTRREALRLIVQRSEGLSQENSTKLEHAILAGPPRSMYKEDLDEGWWKSLVDKEIWIYLKKLSEEGGKTLGYEASECLEKLSVVNPEWKLASHERDEFTRWMSGTGSPDYEERREIDITPRKREEIVEWLKTTTSGINPLYEDTWRETCQTRFFHTLLALNDLACENIWPTERWIVALQVWREEQIVDRSWRYCRNLIKLMPSTVSSEIMHGVSWWLESVSKTISFDEPSFISLCLRVLKYNGSSTGDDYEPVNNALNHPVGHITQGLLNLWFGRKPNDGDTLSKDLEPIFSMLCDSTIGKYKPARVLLASRLIPLFRVDQCWTETYLLPLFSWQAFPIEANAVWEGFLWSPRLHPQLMVAFKPYFLDTANNYTKLVESHRQFSAFLTYAALGPQDGYSYSEFRGAIGILPQEGLNEVARSLVQALEGSGEQIEDYWRNRIEPFLGNVWPKSIDRISSSISESFVRLSIVADSDFPLAVKMIESWLIPIERTDYVVSLLRKSDLPRRFPLESIQLLGKIIDNQQWVPRELRQCLNDIATADNLLKSDLVFQRLEEYLRVRGIE